jgi:hypothetical protein
MDAPFLLPQAQGLFVIKRAARRMLFDVSLEVLPGCRFGCERVRFYSNITALPIGSVPARD